MREFSNIVKKEGGGRKVTHSYELLGESSCKSVLDRKRLRECLKHFICARFFLLESFDLVLILRFKRFLLIMGAFSLAGRVAVCLMVGTFVAYVAEEGISSVPKVDMEARMRRDYAAQGRRVSVISDSAVSFMNLKACKGTLVSPTKVENVDNGDSLFGIKFSKSDLYLRVFGQRLLRNGMPGKWVEKGRTNVQKNAGDHASFSKSFCFEKPIRALKFVLMDKDTLSADDKMLTFTTDDQNMDNDGQPLGGKNNEGKPEGALHYTVSVPTVENKENSVGEQAQQEMQEEQQESGEQLQSGSGPSERGDDEQPTEEQSEQPKKKEESIDDQAKEEMQKEQQEDVDEQQQDASGPNESGTDEQQQDASGPNKNRADEQQQDAPVPNENRADEQQQDASGPNENRADEQQEEPKRQEVAKPFGWTCPNANDGMAFDRIRKDYNDLTVKERQLYIEAVQEAKRVGKFDIFVSLHKLRVNDDFAHDWMSTGFYPWHRKFLLEYENMLRSLGPRFACITIPFWDWAQEAKVCQLVNQKLDRGQVFDEDDHETSDEQVKDDANLVHSKGLTRCKSYEDVGFILNDFGGKGGKEDGTCERTVTRWGEQEIGGCCMTKGPFSDRKIWFDFEDHKCLCRRNDWHTSNNCGGKPCTNQFQEGAIVGRVSLTRSLKEGKNHISFKEDTYGIPHGSIHVKIGGHMGKMFSPQDPLFFSHHAFIDKLWYNHQDCHYEKASNKEAIMWEGGGMSPTPDTELPFCMHKKHLTRKWVKANTAHGGRMATGLSKVQGKDSQWCTARRQSRAMDADMLSSWNPNHKLGDYIDTLNLPDAKVIYWPDDYDRHVQKMNPGLCTMTKTQKDTLTSAQEKMSLLEEGTSEHEHMKHHADMFSTEPGTKWKVAQKFGMSIGKDKALRKHKARENLNLLREYVLRTFTKIAVKRDMKAVAEKGLNGAVGEECKDLNNWGEKLEENSEPMKYWKTWLPKKKLARKKILEKCYDTPDKCPVFSPCKLSFLKLVQEGTAKNKCEGLEKNKCVETLACAWLPYPKQNLKNGGKCF